MKNYYLIILLFITTQTFAQQSKFELGVSLGSGLSTLRGSSTIENNFKGGVSLGLMFQYNATELFSIHSNISYENKGVEVSNTEWVCTNCPKNATILEYEYITAPILARLNFGSKAKFFVNAGPYFGYLINYEWVDNHFDFGLASGLGGQIDLNNKLNLSLEVRNNWGLVPVKLHPMFEGDNLYNNSINLLIGITYRLGKHTME